VPPRSGAKRSGEGHRRPGADNRGYRPATRAKRGMQRARREGGPRRGPPARALLSARRHFPAGPELAGCAYPCSFSAASSSLTRATSSRSRANAWSRACSSQRSRAATLRPRHGHSGATRARGRERQLAAAHQARGVTRVSARARAASRSAASSLESRRRSWPLIGPRRVAAPGDPYISTAIHKKKRTKRKRRLLLREISPPRSGNPRRPLLDASRHLVPRVVPECRIGVRLCGYRL
jgi:hypothetical protein